MRGTVLPLKLVGSLALAAFLGACGPAVSGEVRDAVSGRPIAGARVEVSTVGWGRRDGDLVADKSFTHSASTDARGQFAIDEISGGGNLRVAAPGYRMIDTSLCSRSPMTVRVGGPFENADLGKQLRAGVDATGSPLGWRFGVSPQTVAAADADLAAARLPTPEARTARLRAPRGMAITSGTGNPPAPPASGYVETLDVDLLDCGWLFVRTGNGGMVAVHTGSFALDEPIEGGHYLMLSYGELAPSAFGPEPRRPM